MAKCVLLTDQVNLKSMNLLVNVEVWRISVRIILTEAMEKGDPPGFVRIEGKTGRVFYVTAPDPSQPEKRSRKLYNAREIGEYLQEARLPGVRVEGTRSNKSSRTGSFLHLAKETFIQ